MNDLQFNPALASKASFIGACLTKYGSSLSHIFSKKVNICANEDLVQSLNVFDFCDV